MTVTLLAAQALKSVGFDLPTTMGYVLKDVYKGLNIGDMRGNTGEKQNWNSTARYASAPDILEGVLWLWEKYGVLATFFVIGGSKLMFEPIICSTKFIQESGAHSRAAGEDTNDPITAYNSAIIAACEWAKNKKA